MWRWPTPCGQTSSSSTPGAWRPDTRPCTLLRCRRLSRSRPRMGSSHCAHASHCALHRLLCHACASRKTGTRRGPYGYSTARYGASPRRHGRPKKQVACSRRRSLRCVPARGTAEPHAVVRHNVMQRRGYAVVRVMPALPRACRARVCYRKRRSRLATRCARSGRARGGRHGRRPHGRASAATQIRSRHTYLPPSAWK